MATEAANNTGYSSVMDLLGKSINLIKDNWKLFLVVNIPNLLFSLSNSANMKNEQNAGNKDMSSVNFYGYDVSSSEVAAMTASVLLFGLIFLALFAIISGFFYAMNIGLEVKLAQAKKTNFTELVEYGKKNWLKMVGLFISMAVIIIAGLILLIIPGVIAFFRLILAPYAMIDQKLSVTEALKTSNNLVKGNMLLIAKVIGMTILFSIAVSLLVGWIPIVGAVASVFVTAAFSLVLAFRYFETKKARI